MSLGIVTAYAAIDDQTSHHLRYVGHSKALVHTAGMRHLKLVEFEPFWKPSLVVCFVQQRHAASPPFRFCFQEAIRLSAFHIAL
jgi:hypothetical protein